MGNIYSITMLLPRRRTVYFYLHLYVVESWNGKHPGEKQKVETTDLEEPMSGSLRNPATIILKNI